MRTNYFTIHRLKHQAPSQMLFAWLFAFGFLFSAFSLKAQTYVPSGAMTGTPAAGSYYNSSGITLTNFSFTATSGNSLRIFISPCVPLSVSLSSAQNYVSTIVPRVSGLTSNGALSSLSTCQAMQTIQYLDGLGRPIQTVQVKGNPNASKDVIMPQVYDAFGREATKYLPYTDTLSSSGSYRGSALTAQNGFYAAPPTGVTTIAHPIAQTVFEPSPLNRVLEQGAPGNAWQPYSSSISGSGHTSRIVYSTNNRTALSDTANTLRVALYTATINSNGSRRLARYNDTATYAPGELTVTVSKDENWVSGRAGTVEEYKDKQGHVVLKRTYNFKNGALEMLSTYYVYDDLDLLAFVLPPGASPDATAAISQTTLNNLCYQYRYDERDRLSQKKLPGKGWDMMVYNKLDQPVLSQDSVQRTANQWTVTKYDALGRTIMTGLWNAGSAIGQSTLRDSIYADAQWDVRNPSSTTTGYTISSYPKTLNDVLTLNYYDDYNIPNLPAAYDQHSSYSTMTRGLATASRTAILLPNGTVSTDMLWSAHYYDDKGRDVRSFQQHDLGGVVSNYNYDDISSAYDFTNAVTKTTRLHYAKNSGNTAAVLTLTVADSLVYDHMGRKVQAWNKINNGPNILLNKTDLNEVGQLYTKHLHSANGGSSFLQNVVYGYNERGWMSTSNSSGNLFNMELKYNDGTVPQYNGNIANQVWTIQGQTQQTYTYKYDQLNRLTEGKSANYAERGISYDVMGNIGTLSRVYNNTLIDSLSYNYLVSANPTNQLQSVSDRSADAGTVGYKAGNNWGYTYDGNGNMTADNSKGLSVTYNLLDLPKVNTLSGGTISYTYDVTGQKLRKVSTLGSGSTTEYINGIQYDGNTISFVQTEEGRVLNPTTSPNYEYTLTDHLGNSRVNFDTGTGAARLTQSDDYLPFGLAVQSTTTSPKNNYLYNKKELQDGLGQYDYGARFYDPVIARFTTVDSYAEQYVSLNPYQYGALNPLKNIDLNGDSIQVAINWTLDLSIIGLGTTVITTKINFEGSTAYNSDGSIYTGNSEYVKSVSAGLAQIIGKPNGAQLVSDVESSTNITTIAPTAGGNRTEPSKGEYVLWNPENKQGGPDQSGNNPERPSFIGLAHELAHVNFIWNGSGFEGRWYRATDPDGKGFDIMNSEKYTTYMENLIRAENGRPLRTYYSPNDNGGVDTRSPIIDRHGKNLWIHRYDPIPQLPPPALKLMPSTIPFHPIKL